MTLVNKYVNIHLAQIFAAPKSIQHVQDDIENKENI
jgi:hypothetical protein